MDTYFTYFLQASLGIILFYFVYLLLLKKETFYQTNRYFLLAGLILAALLPLFPVSYESAIPLIDNSAFFSLAETSNVVNNVSTAKIPNKAGFWQDFIQLLAWIYLAGVVLFFIRLSWQTIRVSWKIRRSEHQIIHGIKIIDRKNTMPFSFFNVVIIDIQKYSERELSNIIAHEKVHILERHWIDLLIIELLAVLFWINPVVWLYERSIKQNHEYLADQGVLLAGYSPGQYQALLINQLMGVKVLGFAHNLNFSLNKKRMEMMKKKKSPWASKMKLLLALPIIALLVFAFAKKEYVIVNAENSPANSPLTFEKNEPQNDLINVRGKVFDDQGNPMTGANVILKGTNNGTVVDRAGEFTLEVPKSELAIKRKNSDGTELTIKNAQTLVVSFIGYGTHEYVFDTQKGPEEKEVKISLQKSYYNITLPEIGRNEKMVTGTIVEAPIAEISKDNTPTNDVVELPPPSKRTKDEEIFTIVEDMPYYGQSGMYELANDIKEITDYLMKQTKDRGEVLVGFTVSSEGKVTNPHVVRSSQSKILDGSAIKIVQKLDNWRPGIQRGKKVPVDLTMPVNFN